MTSRNLNDNGSDFELINGKRCLKDKHALKVPMFAMDSVQRSVAQHTSKHRSGFIRDAAVNDAKQQALLDYEHELTNAWRGQDASKKKKRRYYDPTGGHMIEAEGEASEANVGDSFFAPQHRIERQLVSDSEGGIFQPQRVRAFDGSNLGLHRPGVRLPVGSPDMIAGLQADRAEALRLADLAASTAWVGNKANTPTGFGSGQVRAEQAGDPCTRDGYPGVLVEGEDGKLYCKIHEYVRRDAADLLLNEPDDDEDEEQPPRRRRRRGVSEAYEGMQNTTERAGGGTAGGGNSASMPHDSIADRQRQHAKTMARIYQDEALALSQAWRNNNR